MSTSQEQIYDAIRKADAAGDKDSVIKLGQYLSTMKDTQSHDDAKSAPKERGTVGKAFDAAGNFLSGVGDAGGVLATSAVAPVVAGVAGAGKAAYNVGARALGGHPDDAADTVEGVQNALSYQPRTQGGREYVEGITTPLRLLGEGADKAGAYTAEKTGSPLLGAGVNTAIQMLPGLVAPELSGKAQHPRLRVQLHSPPAPPRRSIPPRGRPPRRGLKPMFAIVLAWIGIHYLLASRRRSPRSPRTVRAWTSSIPRPLLERPGLTPPTCPLLEDKRNETWRS
jgi:hypothetical protein